MLIDTGLFLLRIVVGLLFIGHGAQKWFGWFGGPGPQGTVGMMESLRIRPAGFWAFTVGLVELGGGVLFALGLFSPLGSICIAASMLTAIAKMHWPRVWVTENGMEYPVVNLTVVTAVTLSGPGVFSWDAMLRTGLPPEWAWTLTGLMLAGWLIATIASAAPEEAARPTPAELASEDEERRAA